MNTGTDLKLNIHINPLSGFTMDDYDFECLFFTTSLIKSAKIKKEDMIRIDEQNYIAILCTKRVGPGRLRFRLRAFIPDSDVIIHDGKREEVVEITTDIYIGK